MINREKIYETLHRKGFLTEYWEEQSGDFAVTLSDKAKNYQGKLSNLGFWSELQWNSEERMYIKNIDYFTGRIPYPLVLQIKDAIATYFPNVASDYIFEIHQGTYSSREVKCLSREQLFEIIHEVEDQGLLKGNFNIKAFGEGVKISSCLKISNVHLA